VGSFGNCIGSFYGQPTKLEQISELLKAMQEMMETSSLASQIDINQAQMRTNQAKVDTSLKEMREEMMARLEVMIQNSKERMEASHKKKDAQRDANQ
jgi:hypothetical protein